MDHETKRRLSRRAIVVSALVALALGVIIAWYVMTEGSSAPMPGRGSPSPITTTSPPAPMLYSRLAMLASQAQSSPAVWQGFALDLGANGISAQEVFRYSGEDHPRRLVVMDTAPAEDFAFWTLAFNATSNLPALLHTKRTMDGGTEWLLDMNPAGQIGSFLPIDDGRRCAVAMKLQGYWNISIFTAGQQQSERVALDQPGKQASAECDALPLASVKLANNLGITEDYLLLATKQAPAVHVIIIRDGYAVAHTRIPLDFIPDGLCVYEPQDSASPLPAMTAAAISKRLLLCGRGARDYIFHEYVLSAQGVTTASRRPLRFQPAGQRLLSIHPLTRNEQLRAVGMAYEDAAVVQVASFSTGQELTLNALPVPGQHEQGEIRGAPGISLKSRYWMAAPFNARLPDGRRFTCLLAVDRDLNRFQKERPGQTTALQARDNVGLWVLRQRPNAPDVLVPLSGNLQEGPPFPLAGSATDGHVDKLAISRQLSRSY